MPSRFHLAVSSGNRFPKQEYEFYRHTWTFVQPEKKHGQTLAAGNYEWPFEHVINGDFPESIEGMNHTWIVYRMKATMDRGLLAKDVYARQHVRLIRTFDANSLDLSHNMVSAYEKALGWLLADMLSLSKTSGQIRLHTVSVRQQRV